MIAHFIKLWNPTLDYALHGLCKRRAQVDMYGLWEEFDWEDIGSDQDEDDAYMEWIESRQMVGGPKLEQWSGVHLKQVFDLRGKKLQVSWRRVVGTCCCVRC